MNRTEDTGVLPGSLDQVDNWRVAVGKTNWDLVNPKVSLLLVLRKKLLEQSKKLSTIETSSLVFCSFSQGLKLGRILSERNGLSLSSATLFLFQFFLCLLCTAKRK